jgi:hypothetical protein
MQRIIKNTFYVSYNFSVIHSLFQATKRKKRLCFVVSKFDNLSTEFAIALPGIESQNSRIENLEAVTERMRQNC